MVFISLLLLCFVPLKVKIFLLGQRPHPEMAMEHGVRHALSFSFLSLSSPSSFSFSSCLRNVCFSPFVFRSLSFSFSSPLVYLCLCLSFSLPVSGYIYMSVCLSVILPCMLSMHVHFLSLFQFFFSVFPAPLSCGFFCRTPAWEPENLASESSTIINSLCGYGQVTLHLRASTSSTIE